MVVLDAPKHPNSSRDPAGQGRVPRRRAPPPRRASPFFAARPRVASDRCAAAPASARARCDRRHLLAAVRVRPAQRHHAGHVGFRARGACHRSVDTRPAGAQARIGRLRATRTPTFVADADRQMPELTERLRTPAALLLPLARGSQRTGLLAIGFGTAPVSMASNGDTAAVADAFLAALELFRLRQQERAPGRSAGAHRRVLRQSLGHARPVGGSRHLLSWRQPPLRRRSHLGLGPRSARAGPVLRGSSDPEHLARGVHVSADDRSRRPPPRCGARARRFSRCSATAATRTVTVPLRGCRRALGTIVFDGVRVETGGELDLLNRADELGRQLSNAIENMQLLDDVMRSHRDLENTFDSIAHLVAVADRRGRIVHANEAFATRLKQPRERLLDRPLAECVGEELALWLAAHDAIPRSHRQRAARVSRSRGSRARRPVHGDPDGPPRSER